MSSPELDKILLKVGVNPNLYNREPTKLPPSIKPPQPLKKRFIKSKWSKKEPPENTDTPAALKLGPLQEFTNPKDRKSSIQGGDTDRNLKLVFGWIKNSQIEFSEFEDLLVEIFGKVYKNIK